MTNIAITFSQDHPNNIQTIGHLAANTPFSIPIEINVVSFLRRIPAALNKGFMADIHLLLTSPVDDLSKRR